ncbi:disease resistance protein RPM1-like [Camellia sinensis]|uniref:disease resistance protein RPM1-like n=1 Tax=Camellia sinensis TaxID=4442 RepID=UPI001035C401|nr:disease resistance protein RPM1-like [Camellia sinensis]
MSTFLGVADAKEENVQELKVWVKLVRNAAYGTEDVIDKFKLHLAHHHGNGFRGFLCKIPRFIKTLKAHHQIASEVLRIKSKDVRDTKIDMVYRKAQGPLLLIIHGLGKTTLVKKVYDNETVKKHFNSHAWLTVSESINIEDLMKDMIQQLFTEILQPVPSDIETMSINRLKGMVKDFLQQRRYVVVFDDVWKVDVWDAVKSVLPNNNCGSRVILLTCLSDIASSTYCNETDGNVYTLMPLSAEESWMLFCNKTFRGNLSPPHLKEISHKFLKIFNGLPLAIVAISGSLAIKDQSKSRIDE